MKKPPALSTTGSGISAQSNSLPPTLWIRPGQLCWVGKFDDVKKEIIEYYAAVIQTQNHSLKTARVKYMEDVAFPTEVEMQYLFLRSEESKTNSLALNNLVNLPLLSEAELLNSIKVRFMRGKIFSYIGQTLLIVNPFEELTDLFNPQILQHFKSLARNPLFNLRDEQPHIYAIAALAFKQLFDNAKNQSIVISGESGTGKTVNTKYCMSLIASMTQQSPEQQSPNKQSSNIQQSNQLEQLIIQCNPILEAFGNAKTIKNDNSSRFGKFVNIYLDLPSQKIIGARTQSYLLEKSRVIYQSKEERNYHVFYNLLLSGDNELLEKLLLKEPGKNVKFSDFTYLNRPEAAIVNSIDDRQMFKEVVSSINILGISQETNPENVWSIIACVLHLGNLDVSNQSSEESSCQIVERNPKANLAKIAEMLGVSPVRLKDTILKKTIKIKNEEVSSPLPKTEVIQQLHSISKDIFDKLFLWLIFCINKRLFIQQQQQEELLQLQQSQAQSKDISKQYQSNRIQPIRQHAFGTKAESSNKKSIGLLDIFGFEVLHLNSFEQLCINYANEVLQQLYVEYTFKSEVAEFEEQGLKDDFSQITFTDNTEVLNLLVKPPMGIFLLIDDNSSMPATEENLLNKMNEHHKTNPLFVLPRAKGETFYINHTPRSVQYTITGFRSKNKDETSKSFLELMATSSNRIIRDTYAEDSPVLNAVDPFQADTAKNAGTSNQQQTKSAGNMGAQNSSKDKFLAFKFRKQINQLMSELHASDVHFIRCIKPNESKSAKLFYEDTVMNQLRYLGVLESIKIRRDGFPYRKEYKDFFKKFGEIQPQKFTFLQLESQNADFAKIVQDMKIWNETFAAGNQNSKKKVLFGKTKICMRGQAIEELEQIYSELMKAKIASAIQIQKVGRGKISRDLVKRRKLIIKQIIRWLKARAIRLYFLKMKRRCIIIQRHFRMRKFRRIRQNTIVVQTHLKRIICARFYQKSIESIIRIQKFTRIALVKLRQKRYRFLKQVFVVKGFEIMWRQLINRVATCLQKRVRGYLVRNVREKVKISKLKLYMKNWKENKAAIEIQRFVRGFLARAFVKKKMEKTKKIQGFVRSKWLVDMLQTMKVAASFIQMHYRRYAERMRPSRQFFAREENQFNNQQYAELNALTTSKLMIFEQYKRDYSNTLNLDSKEARMLRDHLTMQDKKISFFTLLVDFELLSDVTEVYDPLWNKQFTQLQRDLFAINHEITAVSVGEAHSIASATNGKVYTWGWNDYGQQGTNPEETSDNHTAAPIQSATGSTPSANGNSNITSFQKKPSTIPWIESISKPKFLTTGNNHTLILDSDNNLYVAGRNNIGQLGLGHNSPVQIPERLELRLKQEDAIKSVRTRYDSSIVVSEKGSAWIWPIEQSKGSWIYEPFELAFPMSKISIAMASCGLHFQVFLSTSGLLFAFGSNGHGELGLGDTLNRKVPCLVESLKYANEAMVSVECGQKHVIARSGINHVFTWGAGAKGQLGHDTRTDESLPRQVLLPKAKVIQVQAGKSSCIVLLENRRVIWWGTNNQLNCQASPVDLDFNSVDQSVFWNSDQSDFYPVRIETTWSHSISLTYVKFADTRAFDQNTQFKNKLISTLISKWQESFLFTTDVPFFDSISKHFSNRHILKQTSTHCRKGPKYPSLGTDKYVIPPAAVPQQLHQFQLSQPNQPRGARRQSGFRGGVEDLLRYEQQQRQQHLYLMNPTNNYARNNSVEDNLFGFQSPSHGDSLLNSPTSNQVFKNFVRNSSKKPLPKQIETHPELISPTSQSSAFRTGKKSGLDDENLLDSMEISPNSLLEKYKNFEELPTPMTASRMSYQSDLSFLKSTSMNHLHPQQQSHSPFHNNNNGHHAHHYPAPNKMLQRTNITPPNPLISSTSTNRTSKFPIQSPHAGATASFGIPMAPSKTPTSNRSTNKFQVKFSQRQSDIFYTNENEQQTQPSSKHHPPAISSLNVRSEYQGVARKSLKFTPTSNNSSQPAPGFGLTNSKEDSKKSQTSSLQSLGFKDDDTSMTSSSNGMAALQQKLGGIRSRISVLQHIGKDEWTNDDRLFMNTIADSKTIEFLKTISGSDDMNQKKNELNIKPF